MSGIGWGVWIVRTLIAWIGAGLVAWGVSFFIADYVVKAHTTGTGNSFENINATLGRLEAAVSIQTEILADQTTRLARLEVGQQKMLDAPSTIFVPQAFPEWLNVETFNTLLADAAATRLNLQAVSLQIDGLSERVGSLEVSVTQILERLDGQ